MGENNKHEVGLQNLLDLYGGGLNSWVLLWILHVFVEGKKSLQHESNKKCMIIQT